MGPVIIHVSLLSDLSLQGAKVIITVVFSATRYSDVAKQQLVSAAKKFRLSCNFASKDSMAMALAKTFLKENFVKVDSAFKISTETMFKSSRFTDFFLQKLKGY